MTAIRIGVVGIGNMGLPMALRLQTRGYAVTVSDTNPLRAALATRHRLRLAPSAAEAARYARCTIVAVATEEQAEEVVFGEHGIHDVMTQGDCVMFCTTMTPERIERLARRLYDHGVSCIDAPFSGGPDRASYGTLALVVSCDNPSFERHRPMMEVLSSRVMRVGTRVGQASRAKLVNNVAAAINLAGMAEVMALAQSFGLDRKQMLEIIENASGQNWIGSDRLARSLRADTEVHATLAAMAREAAAGLAASQRAGFMTPLMATAAQQYERACDDGLGASDDSALYEFVQTNLRSQDTDMMTADAAESLDDAVAAEDIEPLKTTSA